MSTLEEIIVTARRGIRTFSGIGPGLGGGPADTGTGAVQLTPQQIESRRLRAQATSTKQPPPKPVQSAAKTLKELQILKAEQQAILDEIVVKAKRVPKRRLLFGLGPFGAGLLTVADVGAKIAGAVSQSRLDEAGRIATSPTKFRPDTKVKTIPKPKPPKPMEEIIVTGKRRPKSFTLPLRTISQAESTPRPTVPAGAPRPSKQVTFADPKVPKLLPATIGDVGTVPGRSPRPGRRPGGRTGATSRPQNVPRSRLLGIGNNPVPTALVGMVGAAVGVSALPQSSPVRVRNNFCPPCPKPKKRNRTKCYKKLVEERRNPARDKTFKWTRIDCDTGREMRKK